MTWEPERDRFPLKSPFQAAEGEVYAIEKKEEAAALLEKNKRKFAADHLHIIRGLAPEALADLPAPTHVFIGGSSGNLKEILEVVLAKNPHVRIVINALPWKPWQRLWIV